MYHLVMAVYTPLTTAAAIQLCAAYALGAYQSHAPAVDGVTNSNYFLTTQQGRYVVTIFEEDRRALNPWAFDEGQRYNVTKAAALLRGYTSIRPLTDAEKKRPAIFCRLSGHVCGAVSPVP